jgi:acyl-CoA thioester hydrolase
MHHSNYFRLFEETRGEFLRSIGFPYSVLRERGFEVVLIDAFAKYLRPVFYDDELTVRLTLEQLTRVKFGFGYTVFVGSELKAKGKTTHCVIKNGKPVPIPEEIYKKFSSLLKTNGEG